MARLRDILTKEQKDALGVTGTEMRTFHLWRHTDISDVSGVGKVAEGVQFSDGQCAMRWLSGRPTTTLYDSVDDLIYIHGHGGATELRWDDEQPKKTRQAS